MGGSSWCFLMFVYLLCGILAMKGCSYRLCLFAVSGLNGAAGRRSNWEQNEISVQSLLLVTLQVFSATFRIQSICLISKVPDLYILSDISQSILGHFSCYQSWLELSRVNSTVKLSGKSVHLFSIVSWTIIFKFSNLRESTDLNTLKVYCRVLV